MALYKQAVALASLLLAGCVVGQPLRVYNSGQVVIQGGTRGNTNIGRKLSQTTVANSGAAHHLPPADAMKELTTSSTGTTVENRFQVGHANIQSGISNHRSISRSLAATPDPSPSPQSPAPGQPSPQPSPCPQPTGQTFNSGLVSIEGAITGNTNIGGKMLSGCNVGNADVSNSGHVAISGGTSGNTNVGRKTLQVNDTIPSPSPGLSTEPIPSPSASPTRGGATSPSPSPSPPAASGPETHVVPGTSGNTDLGQVWTSSDGTKNVANSDNWVMTGGTSGNTNIGRRKMLAAPRGLATRGHGNVQVKLGRKLLDNWGALYPICCLGSNDECYVCDPELSYGVDVEVP